MQKTCKQKNRSHCITSPQNTQRHEPSTTLALSPFLFLLLCLSPSPTSSSFDLSFCSFVEIGSSLLVCPTLSFSWVFTPPPPPHLVLSVMDSHCMLKNWAMPGTFPRHTQSTRLRCHQRTQNRHRCICNWFVTTGPH